MLDKITFWQRALFLAVIMAAGAYADARRRGPLATRPKDYAFIWLVGLIGCVIGIGVDLITSSICADYFIAGKDISPEEGFKLRVAFFGLQQGLSAGVVAGALCVYVSRRPSKHPPLEYGKLLRMLWLPVSCAVLGALLIPLATGQADPAGLAAKYRDLEDQGLVAPGEAGSFLRVWWIHMGLYAGLALGVVALIALVSKRRRVAGQA